MESSRRQRKEKQMPVSKDQKAQGLKEAGGVWGLVELVEAERLEETSHQDPCLSSPSLIL